MSGLRQAAILLLLAVAISALATIGMMALLHAEYETATAMGWIEP